MGGCNDLVNGSSRKQINQVYLFIYFKSYNLIFYFLCDFSFCSWPAPCATLVFAQLIKSCFQSGFRLTNYSC